MFDNDSDDDEEPPFFRQMPPQRVKLVSWRNPAPVSQRRSRKQRIIKPKFSQEYIRTKVRVFLMTTAPRSMGLQPCRQLGILFSPQAIVSAWKHYSTQ